MKIKPWMVWGLLFGWLAWSLGLSDDEAYYWKLAQSPAWGYAFHPPGVGWTIWFFEKIFLGLGFTPSAGLVRIPAVLAGMFLLQQVSSWLRQVGADPVRATSAGWVLFAFAGVFGAVWMMVPDVPMLVGWWILFRSAWNWTQGRRSFLALSGLILGTFMAVESKYTGLLFWGSALLAVLFEARTRFFKDAGFWALVGGLILAGLPVLFWNQAHDWGPLRYQLAERHGDFKFSLIRGLRFWILQLVLAGPLVFYAFKWFFKVRVQKVVFYLSLWFWPAFLVFCLQPWFSDFKFHWSLTAWLPAAILMAWRSCSQMDQTWLRAQRQYALVLLSLVWFAMQWPIFSWVGQSLSHWDARWDVTNDYYGWSDLKSHMEADFSPAELALPMTASRYQTASQVAFALQKSNTILIPRDLKQRDEWPNTPAFAYQPGEWPRLQEPVLFVADNRYSAGPEFKNAHCEMARQYEFFRERFLAKTIQIYRCQPNSVFTKM